jgi:hypothetical protein
MSTRGTYRVQNGDWTKAYFYIHYDNYPEGAACYFKDCLDRMEKNARMDFIKAFMTLEYSELTNDHEAHGDTEFRYNINTVNKKHAEDTKHPIYIEAFKKEYIKDNVSWTVFFDGMIDEFIKKFIEEEANEKV